MARSGWGLVVMEDVEGILGGREELQLYGHLPGSKQCNYRAEVYALLMLIQEMQKRMWNAVKVL